MKPVDPNRFSKNILKSHDGNYYHQMGPLRIKLLPLLDKHGRYYLPLTDLTMVGPEKGKVGEWMSVGHVRYYI